MIDKTRENKENTNKYFLGALFLSIIEKHASKYIPFALHYASGIEYYVEAIQSKNFEQSLLLSSAVDEYNVAVGKIDDDNIKNEINKKLIEFMSQTLLGNSFEYETMAIDTIIKHKQGIFDLIFETINILTESPENKCDVEKLKIMYQIYTDFPNIYSDSMISNYVMIYGMDTAKKQYLENHKEIKKQLEENELYTPAFKEYFKYMREKINVCVGIFA